MTFCAAIWKWAHLPSKRSQKLPQLPSTSTSWSVHLNILRCFSLCSMCFHMLFSVFESQLCWADPLVAWCCCPHSVCCCQLSCPLRHPHPFPVVCCHFSATFQHILPTKQFSVSLCLKHIYILFVIFVVFHWSQCVCCTTSPPLNWAHWMRKRKKKQSYKYLLSTVLRAVLMP